MLSEIFICVILYSSCGAVGTVFCLMSENLSIPIVLYSNENITRVVEHITIDRHLQLLYRFVPYSVTESLISFGIRCFPVN